jgi:hypothetical protein
MIRILFLLTTFIFISQSHAWTSSHKRALQELEKIVPAVKKLPATYKSKLYKEYSLFPDNIYPIPESIVGSEAVDYLKANKIYYTSALHNAEAMPHMFHLLIEALKARDYSKAIVWIGSISHNLNDSASPQYLPSQYAINQFSLHFNLKTSETSSLAKADKPILFLETLFNRDEGITELKKLRNNYKYELISKETQVVSEYLATLPIYLRNASFKHSEYLMDSYQRNLFTDSKNLNNGNIAVARMGIMGIKATADVVSMAWEFAKKKIKFRVDKIDHAAIAQKIDDLIKKRTLKELPIFKDVLPTVNSGKIGILAESYYRFEESALGFSSRYLAAAMMGTLKKEKIAFRALDLKEYLGKQLPSPQEMPVLVVPACELTSGFRFIKKRDINKMLNDYTAAGGRILLISSARASFMGDLSFHLTTLRDETIFEGEIMEEALVQFNSVLKTEGNDSETNDIKVKSSLYKTIPSNFSWMKIRSQLTVNDNKDIVPLAFCNIDEQPYTLGAYLKRKDNDKKAQFIAYSNMVFYPYLLSDKFLGVTTPQLDTITTQVFLNSLELLK